MVVIGVGIGVVLPASGSAAVLYRTPNVIVASTAASGRLAWIEANHSFTCARGTVAVCLLPVASG